MAQLTVLQMFNRLMRKTGQEAVTTSHLHDLTGLKLRSFELLQDAVDEFYGEALWTFAETETTFTLTAGSQHYNRPAKARVLDRESFVNRKADKKMHVVNYGDFIAEHIDWREATTGDPGTIVPVRGKFRVYPKPATSHAASAVDYRYWLDGSTIGTATASAGATFDRMQRECQAAILELAAYKVNVEKGAPQALSNYNAYYGFTEAGEKRVGKLDRCKQSYLSDEIEPSVTVIL